jgi:hypothetical protein
MNVGVAWRGVAWRVMAGPRESFHAKSLNGVLQEIYTAELLITLTRLIAVEAESILSMTSGRQKKSTNRRWNFLSEYTAN